MKKIIFLICLFVLTPFLAFAHQPRLASGVEMQVIQEPEVSKAYYAILKGQPEYYQIEAKEDFNFYLNILVPDLPDSRRDFKVEVYNENYSELPFLILDGQSFNWEKYYEEYAGDSYLKGPEEKMTLGPGVYTIKVFSEKNEGKYVLVVGEKEVFGLAQAWEAITVLPIIKMSFFNKSPLMLLYSILGEWLIVISLGLVIFVILISYLIRKFEKNKLAKKK